MGRQEYLPDDQPDLKIDLKQFQPQTVSGE